jgi:hypothetical protein
MLSNSQAQRDGSSHGRFRRPAGERFEDEHRNFTACTACTSSVGGTWNRRRRPASIICLFLRRRLRGRISRLTSPSPKLDQRIRDECSTERVDRSAGVGSDHSVSLIMRAACVRTLCCCSRPLRESAERRPSALPAYPSLAGRCRRPPRHADYPTGHASGCAG